MTIRGKEDFRLSLAGRKEHYRGVHSPPIQFHHPRTIIRTFPALRLSLLTARERTSLCVLCARYYPYLPTKSTPISKIPPNLSISQLPINAAAREYTSPSALPYPNPPLPREKGVSILTSLGKCVFHCQSILLAQSNKCRMLAFLPLLSEI